MSNPKAYLIADHSEVVEQYTIRHGYDVLKHSNGDNSALTEAEQCMLILGPQMKEDPIGGEDYDTYLETPAQFARDTVISTKAGRYGSLHYMYLGARGGQDFHFHPSAKGIPESSVRHVFLSALRNEETGIHGVTFELFDIVDAKILLDSPEEYPVIEGKAVTPKHTLYVPPGNNVLITFGAGVHRFHGSALAISAHFLDIVNPGNNKGSFLGNTAAYRGDIPEISSPIPLKSDGIIQPDPTHSLRNSFFRTSGIMRDNVERYAGRPLPKPAMKGLVSQLRGQPDPDAAQPIYAVG